MRKLSESKRVPFGNNAGFSPRGDANTGYGYGKLDGDAEYRPVSADGFPYDIQTSSQDDEGIDDETFADAPLLQKKFAWMTGDYLPSKPDYVSRPRDPFTYFDDSTVGLAENLIKKYVRALIESKIEESSMIRLKSRSSEPDGAVTQWGTRIPGGTQFGWSSAYPFPQKEDQYEPVFSLRDLMTKHEDELDRTHGEMKPEPEEKWKKDYKKKEYDKNFPFFWE